MSTPEVWISQHAGAQIAWVPEVATALRHEGVIAHPDAGDRVCPAGIILFNSGDDRWYEEIARRGGG